MTLNIFGHKIKLIKQKGLLDKTNNRGVYVPEHQIIVVDPELKGNELMSTIIHEIVHAVFYRTGIDQAKIQDGVEEIICENVSIAMVENFHLRLKK